MSSITDKFKKEVEEQIAFIDAKSQSTQEFEARVTELKKEICNTIGQHDYFINFVNKRYGFFP